MRRTHWAAIAGIGLLGTLTLGSAVQAGVIAYSAYDMQIGDAPTSLAVTPGDRVLAAIQETSTPVMGWFDTQDWRSDSVQRAIDDVDGLRVILAAGDADDPILLLGGSAIGILHVDDTAQTPIFSADLPLGLSGGSIAALAWDDARGVAYGADDENDTLRWIPVTGASGSVDSESGWPLPLAFTPSHIAVLDAETLLVAGDADGSGAAAIVDLDGDTPSIELLDLDGLSGAIVGATALDGEGWLLSDGGELVQVVASEGGDDDDSAVGDDDDSAVGARSGPYEAMILASDAPTPSVDLLARDGVLYALGGSTVIVLDTDGIALDTFALSGAGAALAASSEADGHLYVALKDLGQVAVLGHGPFLEITAVAESSITSSDDLAITLIAGRTGDSGTCALSATIDGTLAGDGTAVTLEQEVELGVSTEVLVPGAELEAGAHRLHLFCGAEGALGRASLNYYLGDLDAPEDFDLDVGEGTITVIWTDNDDENVTGYDVLFSETAFVEGEEPTGSNADGTITSPAEVASPETIGEETVTLELSSLTNGGTYYVAVAAVDGEGNRGPITEVKTGTPNITGGLLALTGDPGCSCEYPASGARNHPMALLTLSLMLGALVRRRRPGVR